MLHRQKQTRLETAKRLKDNIEKARDILKKCGQGLQNGGGGVGGGVTVKTEPMDVSDATDVSADSCKNLRELRSLQNKIMCDIADGIS